MAKMNRIPTHQNIQSNLMELNPEKYERIKLQEQDLTKMKTGTTTVGFKIKDGVVLATDNRASMGAFVANKNARKLLRIQDHIFITIAGSVADAQYLVELLKAETEIYNLRNKRKIGVSATAKLLQNILYYKKGFYQVGHLLGGYTDQEGPKLFDLGGYGSILDEDYASVGSGSSFAMGVLETEWKPDLSKDEGINLAKKAVRSAIIRDIASGNGIDIAVIAKDAKTAEYRFEIDDPALK